MLDLKVSSASNGVNSADFWSDMRVTPVSRLEGHTGPVMSTASSASGRLLATSDYGKSIFLWQCEDSGDLVSLLSMKGHKNAVTQVAFCDSDPSILASCSADATVAVWDINTGEKVRRFKDHVGVVSSVCFAYGIGSRPLVCSASDDGSVKLYDYLVPRRGEGGSRTDLVGGFSHKFQCVSVCAQSEAAAAVCGSPVLFVGTVDRKILVFDMRCMEQPVETISNPEVLGGGVFTGLSLNASGDCLACINSDGALSIIDAKPVPSSFSKTQEMDGMNGRLLDHMRKAEFSNDSLEYARVSWAPNASGSLQLLFVGSERDTGSIVRLENNRISSSICVSGHSAAATDAAWFPGAARLVTASADSTCLVYALDR